jgi:hypothetical protein
MNAKISVIAVVTLLLLLSGCVSSAAKLGNVQNGMTKTQVIELLGNPDSASVRGNTEYFTYYLTDKATGREQAYMVRLVDTRVESVGRFIQFGYAVTVGSRGGAGGMGAILSSPECPDVATQLRQLQALKNSGEMSEEEFRQAKQEVLATKL